MHPMTRVIFEVYVSVYYAYIYGICILFDKESYDTKAYHLIYMNHVYDLLALYDAIRKGI